MQRDRDVPDRLMRMAHSCAEMGSPLYGALLARAVQEYSAGGPVKRVLDENSERSRLGLRLMAALHYLALSGDEELAAHYPSTGGDGDAGALWKVASDRFVRDAETIEALMDRTLQTNEPARAMPLMAGYCWLAARFDLPMRVFEIGASAGINLRWDGFAYDGGTWTYGGPSPLVLRNLIAAGTPAHLNALPAIAERRGCDLHPLDATSSVDRMELLSFVWPDQAERVERLRAALTVAASMPVEVDRADLLDWIPQHVIPHAGTLTVLVESVLVEHLSLETRRALIDAVHAQAAMATVVAPIAWLRMEPKDGAYATEIFTWPDYRAEGVKIASSDGHAQGIVWSGA